MIVGTPAAVTRQPRRAARSDPRRRLDQVRLPWAGQGVTKLRRGEVTDAQATNETGDAGQFGVRVGHRREKSDGLAQHLRDNPDRFNQIAIVR